MAVRGKTAFILKLLCSLAMVLAALPVHASGMAACEQTVSLTKAHCGMTCCETPAPKPVKHDPCCLAKGHAVEPAASASLADPCKCEIGSLPDFPISQNPVLIAVDHPAVLPSIPLTPAVDPVASAEPGIFGVDSGPPPSPAHSPDLGRAPPVPA